MSDLDMEKLEAIFWGDQREQPTRVRLERVVKALRDEIANKTLTYALDGNEVEGLFNEILGDEPGPEKAAGSATAQTEGDFDDRRFQEKISPSQPRRGSTAGSVEGSGDTAAHDNHGKPEVARAIAGADEAGRSRHVGSERDHGVSRDEAAGESANTVDAQQCQTTTTLPAADVCVWTEETPNIFRRGCLHPLTECIRVWGKDTHEACPSCGKPIKFTEAQR